MEKIFLNEVAIVTGASFGIGRGAAVAFARAGAKVVIADCVADEETLKLIKSSELICKSYSILMKLFFIHQGVRATRQHFYGDCLREHMELTICLTAPTCVMRALVLH